MPPISRCVALFVCLMVAAGVVARADRTEPIPVRTPLSQFPMALGEWRGMQQPAFDPRVLGILGVDEYLNRAYGTADRAAVGLYVGYYATQRQGDTMHSPLNCLPGSGWEPLSRSLLNVAISGVGRGDSPVVVNRLLIEKGLERQIVLYWYQSHGRIVASEYWGKFFLIRDAIRLNRTDGAMVRVMSPVGDALTAKSEWRAEQTAVRFVEMLVPALDNYLPL